MSIFKWFLLLVPLLWFAICLVSGMHYTIEYDCGINSTLATITVKNPDTNTWRSATAGNNDTICTVTKYDNLTHFIITNCNKEEQILFTLSTRTDDNATGDGIMGGSYSETYVLMCQEIPLEGVVFNHSLGMKVKPEAINREANDTSTEDYTEAPVTPTFSLFTTVWDSTEQSLVDNATMSQHLRWKITGPYEYDLLPYTCTANPGTSPIESVQISLFKQGCPSVGLVTGFEPTSSNVEERGELVTDLYAFKFPQSDDITLVCTVKICTRGGSSCSVTCDKKRRRALSRHLDEDDSAITKVVSHLRVSDGFYGSSTNVVSNFLMTSVFSVSLIYLQM